MIRDQHILKIFIVTLSLVYGCGSFIGNPESSKGEGTGETKITVGEPEDVSVLNGSDYVPQSQNSAEFLLTDAAVDDLSEVNLRFKRLSIRHESGKWIYLQLEDRETVNVLSLQDGITKKLSKGLEANPGQYTEFRLQLDSDYDHNVVDNEGKKHSLRIPSGEQTGIKFKENFVLGEEEKSTFVIDFDLRRSLSLKGESNGNSANQKAESAKGKLSLADQYHLAPVMRVAEKSNTTTVKGLIESKSVESSKTYVACIYPKGAKSPSSECLTAEATATVKANGKFSFHFIPEGDYFVEVYGFDETLKSIDIKAVKKEDLEVSL